VILLVFEIKQPRTCTEEREERMRRGEVLPTIGGLGRGGSHGDGDGGKSVGEGWQWRPAAVWTSGLVQGQR